MENQSENRSPQSTSGPQFGLDYEKNQGKMKGWINRYGSSVILPIIALLILAGGIYLYASQRGEEAIITLDEGTPSIEDLALNSEGEPVVSQEIEEEQKESIIIPESRKEGLQFIEKAVRGEGITHLSRRALKNYLESSSQELSNEHKVFVEDYLKDKIGSRSLVVGEEITFSQNLIEEAVNASSTLNPEQLEILEGYSKLIAW